MQKKGKKFKKNKKFRTPAVIFKEYREMHVLTVNLGKYACPSSADLFLAVRRELPFTPRPFLPKKNNFFVILRLFLQFWPFFAILPLCINF